MKVAKARYTGSTRRQSHRGPSGERYRFRHPGRGDHHVEVNDIDDARYLERLRNIEVDWTARGRLLAFGEDVLEEGYQLKRSIASSLDLDFDGQPDEETLDESLQEQIDKLREEGRL